MNVGFYTVFRTDPQHFLHAASLARDVQATMPGVPIVQFTDNRTGIVPGVTGYRVSDRGPMLEQRLTHYATCVGEWLLVDTDVSIRADVRHVFADTAFDVALVDRVWPHLPQPADVLLTMPFNTGVAFSRAPAFWGDVLAKWLSYTEKQRDWLSEQRAVAEVVRTGRYRVKVLPGQVYNYPPASATVEHSAAVWHYKGPERKQWLSDRAYKVLSQPAVQAKELACA